MNYKDNMFYSDGSVKKNHIFENGITTTFKKIFNISNGTLSNDKYQFNEVSKFYQELLRLSKQLGVGDNISVETVYDGKIPEKVFTIHSKTHLDKEQKYRLSELIHNSMKLFSNSEGLGDFFKDAYIIIK